MKSKTKLLLAIVVALTAIASGCAAKVANIPLVEPAMREVRDDLGRSVRVPEKIDRVISLAPSVTEMIFAAGAGDKLVGVTTYCNYPAQAAGIDKVGDTQTPNIEKIIALKPQVVFVSTASQLEAFMKTLAEQGIAVYVTNPMTLDAVFANLEELGRLLGSEERATKAAAGLRERTERVRRQAAKDWGDSGFPKLRVFVQISNDPLFTIGKDSFLTELVEQAGGISVTKDIPSAYPKLSKETAAAFNPSAIFLSNSPDNAEPSSALRNSNAVRNNRVHKLDADILSRPGPRLVDALEQIARMLTVDIDR